MNNRFKIPPPPNRFLTDQVMEPGPSTSDDTRFNPPRMENRSNLNQRMVPTNYSGFSTSFRPPSKLGFIQKPHDIESSMFPMSSTLHETRCNQPRMEHRPNYNQRMVPANYNGFGPSFCASKLSFIQKPQDVESSMVSMSRQPAIEMSSINVFNQLSEQTSQFHVLNATRPLMNSVNFFVADADRLVDEACHSILMNSTKDNVLSKMKKLKEEFRRVIVNKDASIAASVQLGSHTASLYRSHGRDLENMLPGSEHDFLHPPVSNPPRSYAGSVVSGSVIRNYLHHDQQPKFVTSYGPRNNLRAETNKDEDLSSDDSFIFKDAKPLSQRCTLLKKQRPTSKTNTGKTVKQSKSRVLRLQDWCPVAMGADLLFSGVDEVNGTMRTVAVKKRLESRKVELVDGTMCFLIGSHDASGVPNEISSKLKNGLHAQWKLFQKQLSTFQRTTATKRLSVSVKRISIQTITKKNVETTLVPQSTPKTRRRATDSSDDSGVLNDTVVRRTLRVDSAVVEVKAKSPPKGVRTTREKTQAKGTGRVKANATQLNASSGGEKGPVKETHIVTRTESTFVRPTRRPPRKKTEVNESLCSGPKEQTHTRSGRTVKRPNDFWFGGFICESTGLKKDDKRKSNNMDESMTKGDEGKKRKQNAVDVDVEVSMSRKNTKGVTLAKPLKKPTKTKANKENESKTIESNEYLRVEGLNDSDFESHLKDIELPRVTTTNSEAVLTRSHLKKLSAETPPLKYFTSNLRVLKNMTPVQSSAWPVSQRSASEVQEFEKRRGQAARQKIPPEKTKDIQKKPVSKTDKDMKLALKLIKSKSLKSPGLPSKLLKFAMKRRQKCQRDDEDDEDSSEESGDD